jgi:dTDP-4-dehydrorhamnose 3,5-epimerase
MPRDRPWTPSVTGRPEGGRYGSSVTYLVSTGCDPGREFGVSPTDPELDLPWPGDLPLELSGKDRTAPTLAEARDRGLLPTMAQCAARYAELSGS